MNPDIEYAMRVAMWGTTFATAIVLLHFVFTHTELTVSQVRTVASGMAAKSIGWTVHQFYWFQSWLAYSSRDMDTHAYIASLRWVVYGAEMLIIGATILILSPYLEDRLGVHGVWYGAGVAVVLTGLGYVAGVYQ